jgi:hypothetical protein
MRSNDFLFTGIICGLILLCVYVVLSADRPITPKLWFGSSIDVNQDPGIVRVLLSDDEMISALNNSAFRIYQDSYMKNDFYMANKTDDTLKIAATSQNILKFIKFKCSYRGDSSRNQIDIPFKYVEVISWGANGEIPSWGKKAILPPNANVEIDAAVGWDELSKLGPGIIDFMWVYDNSEAVALDSTVTLAQYKSRVKPFRIIKTLETRYDSVYSFSLQSKRMNAARHFDESLNYSRMILQIDSTNYTAMETMTDVLWKQGHFEEALGWALKAKAILVEAEKKLMDEDIVVNSEDSGTFIDRMNFFIDKCQKREPWQGGGK